MDEQKVKEELLSLLKEKAVVQIRGGEELTAVTRSLLGDEQLGKRYGEKAKKVLLEHQGVIDRYLESLKGFLTAP